MWKGKWYLMEEAVWWFGSLSESIHSPLAKLEHKLEVLLDSFLLHGSKVRVTRKVTLLLKSFSLNVYTVLAFQVESSNECMLSNLKNDIHKQQFHYTRGWPDLSYMPNFASLRWVTFLHSHSGSRVSRNHLFKNNLYIWDCGSLRAVSLHAFAFTVWKCHSKLLPKQKKEFLISK